ncbi:Aminoglycoside phosphotransferase [Cordyceps militaris CM01]|uniref:Aminoglycoside phosphotransferase n=1 Tax=Cordyceps militaris (strain CM01) TaxID=983644 RepID=G3JCL4_CORMM|nr:Aminoglycoside phosphotransferase [Cordyceps militaris CM01]EGX93826.1 Aminoglycoside phosphotransferase [Cordyceps militaris CM01]
MILLEDSSQELQEPPREHWACLPELPLFSGPTVPTLGRRFFKHSPTTILKLGADHGEGIMTALAHFILGPCVPRVISIVTVSVTTSGVSGSNRTRHGLVLTHQPGTPLVQLWPSLTLPQRAAVKAELCRLLVLMRARRFSYYGRPTRQPYIFVTELGTETFASCASRAEWDDSRVHALQNNTTDAERAAHLERVQRGTAAGAGGWDRPVLTHGDLSDRNILVDPDTLAVTGFIDWEMANIMPAYFEYVAARLSGGHQPAWRKELLDVLRSVLRCECDTGCQGDVGAANLDQEYDVYGRTLAAWDAVVDVERIAQGYDDDCAWTFNT